MQMLIKNAKLRDREELVNILIDGGKIVDIGVGLTAEAETVIDAEGNLTTASYIDPHIHLDKVNVLDVLPKNQSGTLKEAIEMLWDKKRNYVNEDILARGGDVVEREIKNGVLNIRTHIDVDTITGLKATEGVLALKDKYKGVVDMQTVAFPQEGIMKDPGADKLMWQAMEMGCDVVCPLMRTAPMTAARMSSCALILLRSMMPMWICMWMKATTPSTAPWRW